MLKNMHLVTTILQPLSLLILFNNKLTRRICMILPIKKITARLAIIFLIRDNGV